MDITELGDESLVVADIVIEGPFQPEVRHLRSAYYLPSRRTRDFSLEDLHEAW
jgi:hypothetical protein